MNERGVVTVDYLFAFILVSGFSLILITFSATLSMVEVVQYISYSSARNFFAGNVNVDRQKAVATQKFASLTANPVVAPLLNGGWFEIASNSFIVDFNIPEKYPDYRDYSPAEPTRNLFHGVVLTFNAKVLDMQIPFFGSTVARDPAGGVTESGFSTKITAFLGREPTFDECNSFNEERWEAIKNLPINSGAARYSEARGSDYVVINDNGC